MRIVRLIIKNFRGIAYTKLFPDDHTVLLGDNNTGKTTILEALDLCLGPDRLNRFPPIDEHDFHRGKYFYPADEATLGKQVSDLREFEDEDIELIKPFSDENENTIAIAVILSDFNDEQRSHFSNEIDWWDIENRKCLKRRQIDQVDAEKKMECVRIIFLGHYDNETDDFVGRTYYFKSVLDKKPKEVSKRTKQIIGYLYLRSVRTGSRALSLERGSLLDIILRTTEQRPQMWESTLAQLREVDVTSDEDNGLSEILESIQNAISKYIPREWADAPTLQVTRRTREDLRRNIIAFLATDGDHIAPFYRQGTGTINMLVLAMLSIIRDNKQNVIFAMEEPETAIPPYAQKRIVSDVIENSDQSFFTSHSPYVIEEYDYSELSVLCKDANDKIERLEIDPPDKSIFDWTQNSRKLSEGFLARRIIICEGKTEISVLRDLSKWLARKEPEKYKNLEALGYAFVDAKTDSQIINIAKTYSGLGKLVAVFCDAQDDATKQRIENEVNNPFIHGYSKIEQMIVSEVSDPVKVRLASDFLWPNYISDEFKDIPTNINRVLQRYLKHEKGNGGIVKILSFCEIDEIPEFLRNMIEQLTSIASPPSLTDVSDHGNSEENEA